MKIKHGTTRTVFITKRYAIKIPILKYGWEMFLRGLLANMQEVEFNLMRDERMCPILFKLSGGFLIVMPKCDMLSDEHFNNLNIEMFWPNKNEDYHPDNTLDKIKFNVPVEYKQDSFGIYNNKIVAIDYGS